MEVSSPTQRRLRSFPGRTEGLARGPSAFHPKLSFMSAGIREGTQFHMCSAPGTIHEPVVVSPVENVTEPEVVSL